MPSVYEPAEDSFLLKQHIGKFARGLTLDMGTGSGIQAIEATKYAKKVIAADINPVALAAAKKSAKEARLRNIVFVKSDLFSNLKNKKFDCIIFNPPYLPTEKGVEDIALDAGPKGNEIIIRFLETASAHLKPDGALLLLFSSQSKPKVILDKAEELLFDFKLMGQQHIFFEDLFVYALQKSPMLRQLESNNIREVKVFTHGKHGKIFIGKKGKKKVAIKTALNSMFEPHIKNEAAMLKRVNKKLIGPKLLFEGPDFFVYEFVEGKFILDFLEKASRMKAKKVLRDVMLQCRALDTLHLSKFEMTRPVKHIIVQKNLRPVMIDFERCTHAQRPKNVTQFAQFITKLAFFTGLAQNVQVACRAYKRSMREKDFKGVLGELDL